jgi:16S rRNA (uracil1498-N3)-methyltransferase
MPHDRFYIDAPLRASDHIHLEGEESHHLHHVMRKRAGDKVEIVNGKGLLAKGVVKNSEKAKTVIDLITVETIEPLKVRMTLALALTIPSHLEWAIEKGTELGVAIFLLFPGDLSPRDHLTPNQLQRLEKLTIAAMKQSGRGDLPAIMQAPRLKEWKRPSIPLFFGDIGENPSPSTPSKELIFAVGPEGGWSDGERKQLFDLGGCPLSLHPYILRAETAAIVAATLFLTRPS